MRKACRKAAFGTALGVAGGLAASGFPNRVGLTRAQALVSMPGDLILPTATVQADRVAVFEASPSVVWPFVQELLDDYADLWEIPLQVAYRRDGELLALVSDFESIDQDPAEIDFQASLAVRLAASQDQSCFVHVRERYESSGLRPAVLIRGTMAVSAVTFKRWVAQVRKGLRAPR